MIFTTSGSTGAPKRFELTDEQLQIRARLRSTEKGEVFGGIKSLLCDVSPGSTAFEAYRLWAADREITFITPRGRTPDQVLALCAERNIEAMVSTTGGLLNYALAQTHYKFPVVLGSGTPTSPAQSRIIREKLGEQVFFSYGASEVGSIALATADQVERLPHCVGDVCSSAEVTIEDDLIKVKSPAMASGYLDDAELTNKYFKDGWFIPGDLGEFRDGLLFLSGRASR